MMKKTIYAPMAILLLSVVTGCAQVGDMGAYKTGVEVTQAQMDSLKPGSSKDDVFKSVGGPARKDQVNGVETWYYDFSKIKHFGGNVSETTVFEFDKAGKLIKSYKTGNNQKTGNALLDAAK